MDKIERTEHTIDATDKALGRLASEIAVLLMGKNKPSYQAHIDCGDIVKVQNAGMVKLSGKKAEQREYHRYTGYPGGIKSVSMRDKRAQRPDDLIKDTVRLMLPDTKLRKNMLKRLIIE